MTWGVRLSMPLDVPPVIGREAELRNVDGLLAALSGGQGSWLAISGPPGIGKTRLAAELARRARGSDVLVLHGRGSELDQGRPFGIVVDALDLYLTERRPSLDLGRLVAGTLGELAEIFPSLAESGYALETRLQSERWRLHRAVRRLLEELGRDEPAALVLDDVHWADEASVELLAHLLGRPLEAPVLVVLAYRPEVLASELASAIGAAWREGALQSVELGPLTEREAGRLLSPGISPATIAALHRESGGNPFYLLELSRSHATRNGGAGQQPPGSDGAAVPSGVLAAIADELRSLTEDGRALTQAASVVGYAVDFRLAAEVAELDEARAAAAADGALAAGVLQPGDTPGVFTFRHPIVHKAVYESVGPGWRIGAHARAVQALERRGASRRARAYHLERSATPGDEAAIETLAAAGREVASRAPAAAARWYTAALRLLPARAASERRLSLLVPLAVSLMAVGRIDESRRAFEDAHAAIAPEEAAARARMLGYIAGLDQLRGRYEEARKPLLSALAAARPDSEEAASLELELAVGHWYAAEFDELVEHARTATARARRLDARHLEAVAVSLLALGEASRGHSEDAERQIVEAETLMRGFSDAELTLHVRALLFLGHAAVRLERYPAAEEWLERGARIARTTGQDFWFVALASMFVYPRLMLGDLEGAERSSERAHRAAATLGNEQALVWPSAGLCWVATLQGDLSRALRHGEQARAAARRAPSGVMAWVGGCYLGQALITAGEVDRGIAAILEAGGGADLPEIEPSFRSVWWAELAEAELARRDAPAAERFADRAGALAGTLGLSGCRGLAVRVHAALALARRETEQAVELAESAAELLGAVGRRLDLARAEIVAGRALTAAGRAGDAVERLEAAHRTLTECGAGAYEREALSALRQLGRRPRRRDPARSGVDVEGLSPREAEVARLVALDLTNRQIADALFVSVKTVETHMSHIFEKLSVSSRTAVVSAVARAQAGHLDA
jgi:DNA-binding CsgD family transcriptional regulator